MDYKKGFQKGITMRTMRTSTTFFIDVLEKPFQKVFHKSPPKNHHKGLIYYPFMTTPTKGTPTRTISKNHTQYRISYSIIIISLISTYLFSSFPVGNLRFPDGGPTVRTVPPSGALDPSLILFSGSHTIKGRGRRGTVGSLLWKWCGFTQKKSAKKVLEKNFVADKDYKCLLYQTVKQDKQHGGKNKEQILMTINTFKRFCMKAGTKKAEQIHEYYIHLEETLQEVINEECSQLREQIENQTLLLQNNEQEKKRLREKTILQQFPPNTQCIYYGIIDNKTTTNEPLIKFGNSNYLRNRVQTHKKNFDNFFLINAFKVDNKTQIETAIKNDPFLKSIRKTILIHNTQQNELLSIQNHSIEQIHQKIEEIIQSIEYNPENYSKILQENTHLNP